MVNSEALMKIVKWENSLAVRGIELAERYGFSLFDATIVALALNAGCKILCSEDLQHDQLIANRLRIGNPFTS
jgi:predicted nucleic acid-binding protein